MKDMVSLENVGIKYEQKENTATVLENINLSIDEGECLAIVGGSGSGKTTLLKVIAGLKKPTSGKVVVDSKEITRPLDCVSVIFQDYGLFPWKTVEENMCLPLKLRRENHRYGEVRNLLTRLGLEEQTKMYPCQLSGGQQQRVAIGRALLSDSKMILMDEPFSALDSMTKERMRNYMKHLLWEKQRTSVIVTHSEKEAAMFGDRIAIFSNKGKGLDQIITNENVRQPNYEQTEDFERMKNKIKKILLGGSNETSHF